MAKLRGWQETALGAALTVRYTFGYLAAACLLSVPIQLAIKHAMWEEKVGPILVSLVYGGVFALLFVGMIPMTRVNWAHMRLPEFKIFELAVARNAFVFAIVGFILGWIEDSRFIRSDVWGTVVVLMAFAYGNLKAQTIIFRDFYREAIDRKKEGKLLADLETPDTELPPLEGEDAPAGGSAASAPGEGFPPPPGA